MSEIDKEPSYAELRMQLRNVTEYREEIRSLIRKVSELCDATVQVLQQVKIERGFICDDEIIVDEKHLRCRQPLGHSGRHLSFDSEGGSYSWAK